MTLTFLNIGAAYPRMKPAVKKLISFKKKLLRLGCFDKKNVENVCKIPNTRRLLRSSSLKVERWTKTLKIIKFSSFSPYRNFEEFHQLYYYTYARNILAEYASSFRPLSLDFDRCDTPYNCPWIVQLDNPRNRFNADKYSLNADLSTDFVILVDVIFRALYYLRPCSVAHLVH